MLPIDITLPIDAHLATWPGDPPVALDRVLDLARGDVATVTRLSCGLHSGTHLDAPAHFIRDGGLLESIALSRLIGPCWVADVRGQAVITAAVLDRAGIPAGCARVLLRTDNSARWTSDRSRFHRDFTAVSRDGADWLVEHGLGLVGVDGLSVASFGDPIPTHHRLLGAGVVVVEGLALDGVAPGAYTLVCLPLALRGVEASPVRAILLPEPLHHT